MNPYPTDNPLTGPLSSKHYCPIVKVPGNSVTLAIDVLTRGLNHFTVFRNAEMVEEKYYYSI